MIASVTTGLLRGVAAAALLMGVTLPISQAVAISAQVRHACAGDYFNNCSSFAPKRAQTRRCMRAVGLSKGCVRALVAAGEVSKAEVARRAANRH